MTRNPGRLASTSYARLSESCGSSRTANVPGPGWSREHPPLRPPPCGRNRSAGRESDRQSARQRVCCSSQRPCDDTTRAAAPLDRPTPRAARWLPGDLSHDVGAGQDLRIAPRDSALRFVDRGPAGQDNSSGCYHILHVPGSEEPRQSCRRVRRLTELPDDALPRA